MASEQELKNKCTLEFIKWCCEYAEGFSAKYKFVRTLKSNFQEQETVLKIETKWDIYDGEVFAQSRFFPILIQRAIDGWNRKHEDKAIRGLRGEIQRTHNWQGGKLYKFDNYQKDILTQEECAKLDCLLDIYTEVTK